MVGWVCSVLLAVNPAVVVPLKEVEGHPTIELRLEGKGPFRFRFDTGSGADLIVNQDLATELGLEVIGARRIGDPNAPGAIAAQAVKVGRVALGGLMLGNVEAVSWKREMSGTADEPRGVVGLGLFGTRLVTLDYGRGELILESGDLPDPDGNSVLAASFAEGIPSVPIEVAGVAFRAHVDSGSTGFIGLPLGAAKQLPLGAPPVVVGRGRTASGDYAVFEAQLRGALRVGEITIDNPRVRFVDLPLANLGFDFLRSLVVTIDKKNQRVRLLRTGAPLRPSDTPRLGIVTDGLTSGRLPVARVATGSAAEAAGIVAGDQIVRLNGRVVATMSRYDTSRALQTRPLTIVLARNGRMLEITMPSGSPSNPSPE